MLEDERKMFVQRTVEKKRMGRNWQRNKMCGKGKLQRECLREGEEKEVETLVVMTEEENIGKKM